MPHKPAPFVRKTYELVADYVTNNIVSWSETGENFVIHDPQEFQTKILPSYFKHNNLCSFIRQLNTYGFRKVNNPTNTTALEFHHPEFRKECKSQLSSITRRTPPRTSRSGSLSSSSEDSVHEVDFSPIDDISGLESSLSGDGLNGNLSDPTQLAMAVVTLCKRQRDCELRLASLMSELKDTRTSLSSLSNESVSYQPINTQYVCASQSTMQPKNPPYQVAYGQSYEPKVSQPSMEMSLLDSGNVMQFPSAKKQKISHDSSPMSWELDTMFQCNSNQPNSQVVGRNNSYISPAKQQPETYDGQFPGLFAFPNCHYSSMGGMNENVMDVGDFILDFA